MEKLQVDVWQHSHILVERYRCVPGPIEGVARHSHEEYQFCLSDGVACVYDYRGTHHIVPHGRINVIHPGEPHATSDAQPRLPGATYHMLYLDPSILRDITTELRGRPAEQPYFPTPVFSDDSLLRLFSTLYKTLEEGVDQLEQDVLSYTALTHLVMHFSQDRPFTLRITSARAAALRARDFLHDNAMQNVSLEELARVTGLSAFRLAHVFKQEIGLSPYDYHLSVRILRAKDLIARGFPLVQVAKLTGFYDQSRFSRYFKRFVGTTPGYYARNSKICL